ncbi:MAG: hypothetical protein VX475_24295, partial [Myxococcota bacterium]|nr:hypothetical protein [Myxococcota bacterium]
MTISPPATSRIWTATFLTGAITLAIQSVGCVDIGAPTGCVDEDDCRNGRFCIEGQCVKFEIYHDVNSSTNKTTTNKSTSNNASTPVNSTT